MHISTKNSTATVQAGPETLQENSVQSPLVHNGHITSQVKEAGFI